VSVGRSGQGGPPAEEAVEPVVSGVLEHVIGAEVGEEVLEPAGAGEVGRTASSGPDQLPLRAGVSVAAFSFLSTRTTAMDDSAAATTSSAKNCQTSQD
jgi:hypothetical protein